jgi:glycosyltransferase involved in cell wall biosynthesis
MARALADVGHSVEVHVPAYTGPDSDRANPRIAGLATNAPCHWPLVGRWLSGLVLALVGVWRLSRGGYDVVHLFRPTGATGFAAALLWILRPGPAVVLDADAYEGAAAMSPLEFPSIIRRWWVDLQERTYRRTNDAFTAASAFLLRRSGQNRLQAQIPNFADPVRHRDWSRAGLRDRGRGALGIPDGSPAVLIYTRFAEYPIDSYAELVEAIRELIPCAVVLVLGDGDRGEAGRLHKALARKGLEQGVLQLGWTDSELLPAILASCDAACMPALDTVANAAACPVRYVDLLTAGLPIVAHNVGEASTYVMPGRNGRLLPAGGSVRSMARALRELLLRPRDRDLDYYSRMRIEGDLAPINAARSLERIYARAIELRSLAHN